MLPTQTKTKTNSTNTIHKSNSTSQLYHVSGTQESSTPIHTFSSKDLHQQKPLTTVHKPIILGFDLSGYPRWAILIILSLFILISFLFHGLVQEYIYTLPDFRHGWFITLFQALCYAFNSLFQRIYSYSPKSYTSQKFTNPKNKKHLQLGASDFIGPAPGSPRDISFYLPLHFTQPGWEKLLFFSFCLMFTRGCVAQAVKHVNYTTALLFKSAKLIPVLIGSKLLLNKKIKTSETLAVLLVCIGLANFSLADAKHTPNFSWFGIVWLFFALCCDAIIPNFQEQLMKAPYSVPTIDLLYFGNLFGGLFLFSYLITFGFFSELLPAINFVFFEHIEILPIAWLANLIGYVGVSAIATVISTFDGLVAMMITSLRKMGTIIISSFIFFPKTFTIQHGYSAILVFVGIFIKGYFKHAASVEAANIKRSQSMRETHLLAHSFSEYNKSNQFGMEPITTTGTIGTSGSMGNNSNTPNFPNTNSHPHPHHIHPSIRGINFQSNFLNNNQNGHQNGHQVFHGVKIPPFSQFESKFSSNNDYIIST